MSWNIQYSKLRGSPDPNLESDIEEIEGTNSKRPTCINSRLLHLIGLVFGAIVGTSIFFITLDRYVTSHRSSLHQNKPLTITQCGSTPQEARNLGCRFELHNFAWVPAACYDEELLKPWDAREEWVFASQGLGTGIDSNQKYYAKEEAMRGELKSAWVPWAQHVSHCGLVFKKYQRAVRAGWPMDNWTSSYPHTEHCANNIEHWELSKDAWQLNSELFLKFPSCDYSWQEGSSNDGDPSGHHHH